MTRTEPYIYAVFPGDKVAHYWHGTGWSDRRKKARIYKTENEAQQVARKMRIDNLKAKVGFLGEL